MKQHIILKTPSAMKKEQLLLLKRSMSKKAYKEYCRKYGSSLMIGCNYGTRRMDSVRDYSRKRRTDVSDEIMY